MKGSFTDGLDDQAKLDRALRLLELVLETGETVGAVVDEELRHSWIHSPEPEPSEEEILDHRDDELFPESVADPTIKLKTEALEQGEKIQREFGFAKDWGFRRFRAAACPARDEEGNVEGVLWAAQDLTDRYEILNRTTDAVYTLDTDWTITFWNDAMADRTGIDASEVIGQDFWDVFEDELPDEVLETYRTAMETGESAQFQADIPEPYDYTAEVRVFPDEDGLTVYSRDVTERLERTRELREQKERLDGFAEIVAHDIRSPLSVAAGAVDMAQRTGESARLEEALDAIHRIRDLVDDLLFLAREGEPLEDTQELDLDDLAQEAWGTIDTGQARLDAGEGSTVEGHRGRLLQLLENLFRNAIEHAGPELTVRLVPIAEGGFVVEDDGPGIPKTDRERVLDHGFSTSGTGSGLGLAIVEDVAQAHDWEIQVTESSAGGARFEFRPH